MEACFEAGVEDIHGDGETFQVLGPPNNLIALRSAVEAAGMTVDSAEIVWIPMQTVEVDASTLAEVETIVDALEDHDDVQKVYTNLA
jgi:transcriptional/translational regulatory protein YebC/TACO1